MGYSINDRMVDVLIAEGYESFDNGMWSSDEEELAEERGEDEYDYDRDALKKILTKWEKENSGFASIWVAPDGSWFTFTIEAYFHCSENKDYVKLLFNAFEAGCESERWGQGDHEADFAEWRKHTRTA